MENIAARYIPYKFYFKQPAGTSRGTLLTKDTWFLVLSRAGHTAIGECAMFRGLSADDTPDFEQKLASVCTAFNAGAAVHPDDLSDYPAIRFGLECALGDLQALEKGETFMGSDFTAGKDFIPINGLVWMGSYREMSVRVREKIEQGYRCIKIKIGAIRFEEELELIRWIRRYYTERDIEIRVDANGAFSPVEAPERLKRLADLHLHSIEQPIRAGQVEAMARLCETPPLPIALDEELIDVRSAEEKQRLLRQIKPQYIVLKPSLVGGIRSCQEWTDAAMETGTDYWITSALESNVGLYAIARFSYLCRHDIPQGLGTGALFTANPDYPFDVAAGRFRLTAPAPPAQAVAEALAKQP